MEKTLIKGLNVLEAVARKKKPCGVSELAAELKITKSNAFRLLQTLTAAGYVRHDGDSGLYSASLRLFELGMIVGSHIDVREIARPVLASVVEKTMENASIGMLEGTDVVFIDRVDSPHRIRAVVRNGERLPAHTSSSGKVLLAFGPPEAVERMRGHLDQYTDRSITKLDLFQAQLARIRADGYCHTRGEWHEDISSVSVPIVGRNGEVTTSLMVSGPTMRITDEKVAFLVDTLRWGAGEIAARMP